MPAGNRAPTTHASCAWDAIRLVRALTAHAAVSRSQRCCCCTAHASRAATTKPANSCHCPASRVIAGTRACCGWSTDWPRIVGYYEALLEIDAGAAPRLSQAIAWAEAGEPYRARVALETMPTVPDTLRAHAHAALSHALLRLDDHASARAHLLAAIDHTRNDADRRRLERRFATQFAAQA